MMSVRSTNVYKKLILSHTVIILIISVLLGCASLVFFNWNYNEEIKKYNEQMLVQKTMSFQTSIMNTLTETSYMILSNFQGRNDVTRLFDGPVQPSDWKITQAYVYLQNIVSQNSKVIESISVYCLENKLFLSTVSGVNHMDTDSASVQWMAGRFEALMETSQCLLYERPIDIYSTGDSISSRIMLYTSYPLSPLSGGGEGLLCITIRNSYLESLLNDNQTEPLNMTFLLTSDGNPVNRLSGFPETLLNDSSFTERLSTDESFLYTHDGSSYCISSQKADGPESSVRTGFRIVNASLTDSFHGRSTYFVWFLAGVCLGAIAVGLLIAWRFSKSLYRPLKETVTKISKDLPVSKSLVPKSDNEYNIINDYISLLHQKASNNLELIYHTVITNLLTVPLQAQEIEKQLFSAGIEFTHPSFIVCMAELKENAFSEGNALSFFQLKEEILLLSDGSISFHAAFPEEGRLGILINANQFPVGIPEKIHSVIRDNCGIYCKLYYSSPICDVEDIHRSYSMLLRMRRYEYFFPDRIFFDMAEFYRKDLSVAHLSTGISAGLAPLLRSRKKEGIRELLEHMRNEIETGDYSYESCNSRITKMIYILSEYIKEVSLEKDFPLETVHNTLSSLDDISEFTGQYLETVDAVYQTLDSRNQSQSMDVVRRIQDYILENLQSDISLDDAARLVSLSPQYVSRLFRDGIGITFVAFIKKCKMEKARELLRKSGKNVDQVAEELGYNSTAYFIKNFKDAYGITPKAYQRQEPIT